MMPGCPARCSEREPTRRRVLALLSGFAAAPALGGCDQIASLVVSERQVVELGLETWTRLRARTPASSDPAARELVGRVTTRLLTAGGGDPSAWETEVFAEPAANAFVLPGRKIGVYEGMIRVAEGEDALAAVIGHEIGHLEAEHPEERLTAEVMRQWGLQLIALLLEVNEIGFAREIAALLGVGVEFGLVRPYGRSQELEADRIGLFMMVEAGYDPQAAVALWSRMDRLDGQGVPAILSTHPAPADRIEALKALIPEAVAAAGA